MKKKVLLLTVVGFIVLGGTVSAAMNYYAGLLYNQKDQISKEVNSNLEDKIEEAGEKTHHDMVMFVETTRNEIIKELDEYTSEKLKSYPNENLNSNSKEVLKVKEQIIKELKLEIDKRLDKTYK